MALDGDKQSFWHWLLYPWKRDVGIHWIGGLLDTRAGLDVMAKRKFFSCQELNPSHSAHSQSLYLTDQYGEHLFYEKSYLNTATGNAKNSDTHLSVWACGNAAE